MTSTIATDVVNFKTAKEVWKALKEVYGAMSKARIKDQSTSWGSTKHKEGVDKNGGIPSYYEASFREPTIGW